MSDHKKEKTKTITQFDFNIDTNDSDNKEIPTITNLLGRKKLKIQKIEKEVKDFTRSISMTMDQFSKNTQAPPPPKKEEASPAQTAEPIGALEVMEPIELVSPPDDSYHFKTYTGFDKNLPLKENSLIANIPIIKTIENPRSKNIKQALLKNEKDSKTPLNEMIHEMIQSGASSVLFLKKTPENTYSAQLYDGPIQCYYLWRGIEYKKSLFPDFFDEMLKETSVSSLDKIKSKHKMIKAFGLNKSKTHYFANYRASEKESGFLIISADAQNESKIKSAFLKQNPQQKAA